MTMASVIKKQSVSDLQKEVEALRAELSATKEKLELAEKRISESNEQTAVGIVQTYSVLGETPSAHLKITPHGKEVLKSMECVYTMPPIPPELAELQREILDMKETCTALRMGWDEASNENAELRKQLESEYSNSCVDGISPKPLVPKQS